MPGFAFSRRQDIEKVLRLIGQSTARKIATMPQGEENEKISFGVIAQTPGGGIAARSGTTVSAADCTPYYIDATGELTAFPSGDTIEVWNIVGSAIAGNAYITCKLVGNKWVADAEDCA